MVLSAAGDAIGYRGGKWVSKFARAQHQKSIYFDLFV